MKLYFIGGASGSGKTAVMPHLKELLGDDIAVYDFDDIGVPDGADKKWRGESTEKWLQKLLSEGKDACLLGQIVLGEILSCPSAKQIDKINFCLLDVSDFERIGRLKKRNTYGADQNMLNWAAWLRMHHQDPQWMPHVIQEDAASPMDFSRLSSLKNYEEVANVKILDTTELALHEVAMKLANWIKVEIRQRIEIITKNITLQVSDDAQKSEVLKKLGDFNRAALNIGNDQESSQPINYNLQYNRAIIGGIHANLYFLKRILHVDHLFVEEKYRGQDLGSVLLEKVEKIAKEYGANLVHLDTFDFQAKDFYLKHGYEVFGVLDDCPKGHKRYYMKKVL
jgi:GNAT superfamily N-acetyltransferase